MKQKKGNATSTLLRIVVRYTAITSLAFVLLVNEAEGSSGAGGTNGGAAQTGENVAINAAMKYCAAFGIVNAGAQIATNQNIFSVLANPGGVPDAAAATWSGNANENIGHVFQVLSVGGSIFDKISKMTGGPDTVVGAAANLAFLAKGMTPPGTFALLANLFTDPKATLNGFVTSLSTLANAISHPLDALKSIGSTIKNGFDALFGSFFGASVVTTVTVTTEAVTGADARRSANSTINNPDVLSDPGQMNAILGYAFKNPSLGGAYLATTSSTVNTNGNVVNNSSVYVSLPLTQNGISSRIAVTADDAVTLGKYILLKFGSNPTPDQQASVINAYRADKDGYINSLAAIIPGMQQRQQDSQELMKNIAQKTANKFANNNFAKLKPDQQEDSLNSFLNSVSKSSNDQQQETMQAFLNVLNGLPEKDRTAMTNTWNAVYKKAKGKVKTLMDSVNQPIQDVQAINDMIKQLSQIVNNMNQGPKVGGLDSSYYPYPLSPTTSTAQSTQSPPPSAPPAQHGTIHG